MIELLTGNPPFVDQHPQYAMSLISKSKPPRLQGNDFSQLAKDFVARCLCENPADVSFFELINRGLPLLNY